MSALPAGLHASAESRRHSTQPWFVPMQVPEHGQEWPQPLGPHFEEDLPTRLRWTHWAAQVLRLVVKYQQNPLRAARALSYVHVAMHDAWVHASNGPNPLGAKGAEIAAHRAASLLAQQLYPNETPGTLEARFVALALEVGADPAQQALAQSVGERVARQLVDRSLKDGAGRVWPLKNRPAPFPGIWQPSYPLFAVNPAEGFAPQWRPWVVPATGRFVPPPAPRPGSAEHERETLEVVEVAESLTTRQRAAAEYWHLDAGSVTPAGIWTQLALRELEHSPPPHTARVPAPIQLLAALSVAMHDAFIACWAIKMRDWSERPITAVRRQLRPAFVPLLVTPGFPSYVSGHATVSSAAEQVLAHFYPGQSAAFRAMAEEAAESRLWGGIHFRGDNDQGLRLGRSVGNEVVAKLANA